MKKYLLSSIVLHGLLIVAMVLVWKSYDVKTLSANIVQTYAYQKSLFLRPAATQALSMPGQSLQSSQKGRGEAVGKGIATNAGHVSQNISPIEKRITLSNADATLSSKNNKDEILIRILHDAIAKVQQYPESALVLNQSGNVMIGFKVSPDGQLSEIQLEKTSGYDRLDQAALAAARSIVTIHEAKRYLTQAHHYSIQVQFVNG